MRAVAVFGLVLLAAAPASAQPRFEAGGGLLWTGALSFGDADANESTASGTPTALFATSSELGGAVGVDGRLAVRISPSIRIEGAVSLRRPQLRTEISSDVEGIPGVEAVGDITEVAVEGAIVRQFAGWRLGGGATPFVIAGGGYLRHLHEERAFVQSGQTIFIGGGMDVNLSGGGVGLRIDLRAVAERGVAFDERSHAAPRVGASVCWRF